MRDLRLNALRAFAAVYAEEGVRAGADRLGVSHSSVSRHIKELEAWVGLPLIAGSRGRRRVEFTAQGEALGKAALESIATLQKAVSSIRESRSRNAVVISTTASVAIRWLLPRLPEFQKQHSSIEVSVLTEQSVTDLRSQGADLAIRMGRGPWDDVDCEPLMDDALYPVVHPNLCKRTGRRRHTDIFAAHPIIHDRDPAAAWSIWFAEYPSDSVDLRRGPRFSSTDLVLRAAAQQIGIALARGRLADDALRSRLLIRPFGDAAIEIKDAYWIVKPKHVARRGAVDIVAAWLKSEALTS